MDVRFQEVEDGASADARRQGTTKAVTRDARDDDVGQAARDVGEMAEHLHVQRREGVGDELREATEPTDGQGEKVVGGES